MASNFVLLVEGCSEDQVGWIARVAHETAEAKIVILEVQHQEVANLLLRDWSLQSPNRDHLVILHIGIDKINGFATLAALMQIPASICPNVVLLWQDRLARRDAHSNRGVEHRHDLLRQRLEAAGFTWISLDEIMTSRTTPG